MATPPTELEPYLAHLRALPFVRGVRLSARVPANDIHADYELAIRTAEGEHRTLVELKKSHVTRQLVDRLAKPTKGRQQRLLFAPAIGRELGDLLEQRKLGFVDRAGNCYLSFSDRLVARIQGKRAARRAPAEKAMRAPAYRALFALLADPKLVDVSVRALAEAAGVSRQAAVDIRHRLQALGILYAKGEHFGWVPRNASKALDLFIVGYATTLRPQLALGRFRTSAANPTALEQDVTKALKERSAARWGGGAACMRMTKYYRGERTILHVDELPRTLLTTLRAVPDRNGPLEFVGFPGPLGKQGVAVDLAHPLLVYAELLMEGEERAREAAAEILERWLSTERFT